MCIHIDATTIKDTLISIGTCMTNDYNFSFTNICKTCQISRPCFRLVFNSYKTLLNWDTLGVLSS